MTEHRSDRELAVVHDYHARTTHRPGLYAAALGWLDWANQPDPFRRYRNARLVPLALPREDGDGGPRLDDLARAGSVAPAPLDRTFVARLLFDSLALSAWKEYEGSRWALRVNPSSGNLHPTEGYVLLPALAGLCDAPALWHYAPREHGLELRATFSAAQWRAITQGIDGACVLLPLTSIVWREAWKYGERAFRYCQHDAGHAIGQIALAAAALGWDARLAPAVADETVARLCAVDRQKGPEVEHVDGLLVLTPRSSVATRDLASFAPAPPRVPDDGDPAPLSASHHPWAVLDNMVAAVRFDGAPSLADAGHAPRAPEPLEVRDVPARRMFHQRRSAVAFDGSTSIPRDVFFRMLRRLDPGRVPFTTLPWQPAVHLALFVHRVDGVEPGFYLLARTATARDDLRTRLRSDFRWERVTAAPPDLDLWLLARGECQGAAANIACGQAIAGDGCFALGMLTEFGPRLEAHGPAFYRSLHHEAGVVGQVLYLEAEAAGVRATGIGCFFDDAMHELLGIARDDLSYRTLYHFTVGGPVEDERLRTIGAYAHRAE